MKVTAQEEYGLRCLIQLAKCQAEGVTLTIPEISAAEGLSGPYVGKLMSVLRNGGLVTGVRGRSGGYTLSRNPRAITLDEVLTILGGRLFTSNYCDKYHGSLENCVHTDDCTIRSVWGSIELILGSVLKRMTLADLIATQEVMRESLSAALRETLEDRRADVSSETSQEGSAAR
jgi:Rrf2 family protein